MATALQKPQKAERSAPERALRSLVLGSLVFRWIWLVWMCALALSAGDELRNEAIAWASLGGAGLWTIYLTLRRNEVAWPDLVADLAICGWLVAISGIVVPTGDVVSDRPFFATGYPLSAPLMWGALGGVRLGTVAGGVLALIHLLTRPLNGVALGDLTGQQIQNLAGAMLNYLVAGAAVGFVSNLLAGSAEALRRATADLVSERELAARLAERESIGREIHDSVLQVLALVNKRGRELAQRDVVEAAEVSRLAGLAADQEKALRALISREPEPTPSGRTSLRDELETIARQILDLEISVVAVGPLMLDSFVVREVAGAVRQALENVSRHAGVHAADVFADAGGGTLQVSVRDAGIGFEYDESALAAAGKIGILKSMKGRVEDLGGTMTIDSLPGRGTEVEFQVPIGDVR